MGKHYDIVVSNNHNQIDACSMFFLSIHSFLIVFVFIIWLSIISFYCQTSFLFKVLKLMMKNISYFCAILSNSSASVLLVVWISVLLVVWMFCIIYYFFYYWDFICLKHNMIKFTFHPLSKQTCCTFLVHV